MCWGHFVTAPTRCSSGAFFTLFASDGLDEVRRVLRAAASTYVVGVLRQVGFLLALVMVAEAAHRATT
jgi:Zn-dependent membrane protease YugP